jgi:hypothetical protein
VAVFAIFRSPRRCVITGCDGRDAEDQCITSQQTMTNRLGASRSTIGRVSSRHDHATSLVRTAGRDSTRGGHNASPYLFISNRSKHRKIQIGLPLKYQVFTTIVFLPTAQKS